MVYADLIGTGIDRNIEIENDCVSEKVVTFKRLEIFHSTCLNLLSNVSFSVEITLIFLA